ncbi:RCC1 domain-containing protein 1 [Halotydeus destructor]|nr:RCC1 domain-containing protein 1 [Halotydeus destructor]
MSKELIYCGFESHIPFTFSKDTYLKSLNDLRWSPLQKIGDTAVKNAWLGWCSLYVQTADNRFFHFGYDNPDKLPVGEFCNVADEKMKELVWTTKRTFAVTEDGKVLHWPLNDFHLKPIALDVLGQDSLRAVHISAGTTFACVLYQDGSVKGLEIDSDQMSEPVSFTLKDDEFTNIATGNEHIIMLTKKGRVYTYGRGNKGQLGHGCVEDEVEDARLVEALDGLKIERVEAGGWHSMAVSSTGDLYAWGWNESGQLGFRKSALPLTATPLPVDAPEDNLNWKTVGCGSRHTMAATEDGRLFAFGWNKYGQLGIPTSEYPFADEPTIVRSENAAKTLSVKCSYWSSLIEMEHIA